MEEVNRMCKVKRQHLVNKKRKPRIDKEEPLAKRLPPWVRHLAPKTPSDPAGGLPAGGAEERKGCYWVCRPVVGRCAVAVQESMPTQLRPLLLQFDADQNKVFYIWYHKA